MIFPRKSTYYGEEGLEGHLVSGKSEVLGNLEVDLQSPLSRDSMEAVPRARPFPFPALRNAPGFHTDFFPCCSRNQGCKICISPPIFDLFDPFERKKALRLHGGMVLQQRGFM